MTAPRQVVSADDVRAAHRRREHRLTIPGDAIVTPLARDEAARWGIELVEEVRGARPLGKPDPETGGSEGPSVSGHAATCDPDDLERVIERVRRQVPEADPAVVRQIAERVLMRMSRP